MKKKHFIGKPLIGWPEKVDHYKGVFLSSENITTRPATLLALSSNIVELSICEGRYHQVKRMFGFFQNEVLSLHRLSVGDFEMEEGLMMGQYRALAPRDVHI